MKFFSFQKTNTVSHTLVESRTCTLNAILSPGLGSPCSNGNFWQSLRTGMAMLGIPDRLLSAMSIDVKI